MERVSERAARRKPITQSELRAVIALQNRAELAAAAVRRRLDSGAALEPGRLAASSEGMEPIAVYRQCTTDDICGLRIAPARQFR